MLGALKSGAERILSSLSGSPGHPNDSRDATSENVIVTINETCRDKGGVYFSYRATPVAWNDATRKHYRGSTNALACHGPNRTNVALLAEDGRQLYVLRSDNWCATVC